MARAAKSKLSLMEELAQLDRRRDELRSRVIDDAEASLREAVDRFNSLDLGRQYELREAGARSSAGRRAATSRKGTRKVSAERACPVCGFKTTPPHDARAHRGQAQKRMFTAEELSARGFKKG